MKIRRAIGALVISLGLAGAARAAADVRDPLEIPLRSYGLVLGASIFGGIVSWLAKVRRGDAAPWNVSQLVGELCTSAFAGLLCFWLCQWAGLAPLLTAPLAGIAGHMGTRAIATFEAFAERRWGAIVGEPPEAGKP